MTSYFVIIWMSFLFLFWWRHNDYVFPLPSLFLSNIFLRTLLTCGSGVPVRRLLDLEVQKLYFAPQSSAKVNKQEEGRDGDRKRDRRKEIPRERKSKREKEERETKKREREREGEREREREQETEREWREKETAPKKMRKSEKLCLIFFSILFKKKKNQKKWRTKWKLLLSFVFFFHFSFEFSKITKKKRFLRLLWVRMSGFFRWA